MWTLLAFRCWLTCWKDWWSSGESWRKIWFESHLFTFSTHVHLYSFIPACGKGCRCCYRLFYFVIVNVCLFLYRQACRYLLIYVLWISFRFIWSYQSFFSTLVLVFVTRVLALCRDGLKQMSDLPFFVLILFLSKKKLWHTELMTQNETSNAWAICRGWPVNYFCLKRLSCHLWLYIKRKSLRQPSMSP